MYNDSNANQMLSLPHLCLLLRHFLRLFHWILIRPRVGFAVGHYNGNIKDVTGGLNITLYLIALYMFSLNRLWSGQFLRHNMNIRLGPISIELKLGLDNGIVLQDSYLGLCWRNIKEAQYIVYNFFEGSCSLVSKSHWRSR